MEISGVRAPGIPLGYHETSSDFLWVSCGLVQYSSWIPLGFLWTGLVYVPIPLGILASCGLSLATDSSGREGQRQCNAVISGQVVVAVLVVASPSSLSSMSYR